MSDQKIEKKGGCGCKKVGGPITPPPPIPVRTPVMASAPIKKPSARSKCLARWVVGPVPEVGLECLKMAVRRFTALYPSCELVVQHNGLSDDQLKFISSLKIPLITQDASDCVSSPQDACTAAWKLCPPRLDPARHELVMDNDLLLDRRIEELDQFFNSDKPVISEGLTRAYGNYDDRTKPDRRVNSGLVGLPPHFDYEKRLRSLLRGPWADRLDEQGLVSAALPDAIIIPISKLPVLEHDAQLPGSWHGLHFVSLNRREHHRSFRAYRKLQAL